MSAVLANFFFNFFSELCAALKPLTAGRFLILCVISVQDKSVDLRWKATEAFKELVNISCQAVSHILN